MFVTSPCSTVIASRAVFTLEEPSTSGDIADPSLLSHLGHLNGARVNNGRTPRGAILWMDERVRTDVMCSLVLLDSSEMNGEVLPRHRRCDTFEVKIAWSSLRRGTSAVHQSSVEGPTKTMFQRHQCAAGGIAGCSPKFWHVEPSCPLG
jgi:hypothetical protein